MVIGIITARQNIEKSPIGAIACALAHLGHTVKVANIAQDVKMPLSFHLPTLNITECDINDVERCKLIFTDIDIRLSVAGKTVVYVAETLRAEHLYWLNDIKKRAQLIVLCTQDDTYAVAADANLSARLVHLGAPPTVHLIHPDNCFAKLDWVVSYDYDDYNCLITDGLAKAIFNGAPEVRLVIISHRTGERINFHDVYRKALCYYNEVHNIAPLPIIATSKAVISEAPHGAPHFYFPYRTYHTALALNCYFIAVGYNRQVNLPAVIQVGDYDSAVAKVRELVKNGAPTPIKNAEHLKKLREQITMDAILLRAMGEVLNGA